MDKIEKMAQLMRIEDDAMWDFARKNGFVNPYTGTITDRPVLRIYANYGVLSHEKQVVYTYANTISDIYEEVYVEVPEGFKVYDSADGLSIIISASEGYDYMVDELLKNVGGVPAFVYVGKDGGHRTVKCRVLEA